MGWTDERIATLKKMWEGGSTASEIAAELGFRSANAAEEHLQALARKGVIELVGGTSRGIRLKGEMLRALNEARG